MAKRNTCKIELWRISWFDEIDDATDDDYDFSKFAERIKNYKR